MWLLYLDESGNPDDPSDRYFVLGGLAVFERHTYFRSQEVDEIQTRYFPGSPPIEFHTAHIRAGRGFWRDVDRDIKDNVLHDIGRIIGTAPSDGLVLFAAAIEKDAHVYGEHAVKVATEQICKRFDTFLVRKYHEEHDAQRGLVVLAEGRFHQRSRLWVQEFRNLGTQWGVLRNLADIPYFAATKETRLLQLADYVAHATYLLYERRDASLARAIMPRFFQSEGIIHSLVHVSSARTACECPPCASRRVAYALGAWVATPAISPPTPPPSITGDEQNEGQDG